MTTRRYIRRCRLQVFHQGQRIVTVEDAMRIAFVIRKDSNQATQTSNISIYNLAPPTASVIHLQGDSVRLEAGYEGNPLGLLFEGEILPDRINHDRTALERITTIGLGNAHTARTMTIFSRSYGRTTVRQIAQDIVAELGIPLDANSLALLPTDTVARLVLCRAGRGCADGTAGTARHPLVHRGLRDAVRQRGAGGHPRRVRAVGADGHDRHAVADGHRGARQNGAEPGR